MSKQKEKILEEKITKNEKKELTTEEIEKEIKKITDKADEEITKNSKNYMKLGQITSSLHKIIENKNFNEELFIKYQNYFYYNIMTMITFIETHKLSEEFVRRFFRRKAWGILPQHILKHQPHLKDFIIELKEYINPEDYEKYIQNIEKENDL